MFSNVAYLKWILKHYRPLAIVQLVAIVLSVVFSSPFFIARQYKSMATVYPYNMSEYSHELPSEQMIEFLNSVDIKNDMVARFNLARHYNIKQDGKPYLEKLYGEYDHNIVVKPTEFGAVDITVYDASPDTAYEMVKGILDILNKKILQVQEEKSVEVADMWKKQVDLKKHQVDSMENLSKQLSTQYGLLEYGNQTKEVSRAYYQALAAGKGSKQYDELALQLKNMQEHGIEFKLTNQHVEAAVNDYNALELKYEDALKDVNKQLTFWNMVSAPYKPDTYCYPIRSLIVLGTCLAALLFSIVFMRGAERIKE